MEELENEKAEVVVLGCNYANTLGVVKSLGEAGYKCGLLHHTSILKKKRITPDMASRYVVKKQYIDRKNDDEMLYALMVTYGKYEEKLPVIAADDYSASFLDRFYDELSPYFRIACWEGGSGRLTYFMEKEHQKEEALKAGFNTAAFWPINVPKKGEKADIPSDMIFPCICKPEVSAGNGMSKEIMQVCQDMSELKDYFNDLSEKEIEGTILVEQFLTIDEEYTVPGLRLDDKVIVPSFIKKIVTGSGKVRGLTVMGLVESTDTNPELKACIERLVTGMGICGMFDVEVIKSNGKFYFNEINLRSSAATYGVTGSGVNIPGILVDYLYGNDWEKDNTIITPGKKYINEKPALQCFVQKDYSLQKYKKLMKDADIHLLTGDGDEGSKAAFLVYEKRNIIKRYVYKEWMLYQKVRSKFSKDNLSDVYSSTKKTAARYKNGLAWKSASMKRNYAQKHHLEIVEETDDTNFELVSVLYERNVFGTRATIGAASANTEADGIDINENPPKVSDVTKDSLEKIKADGGKVYTARYKGGIAGMIDARPLQIDEWCFEGRVIMIVNLCVDQKYGNLGIGTALVRKVLEDAEKNGMTVITDVRESNIFASDFYRRRGFKNVRIYRSGDHFRLRLMNLNGLYTLPLSTFKKMYIRTSMKCALEYCRKDGSTLHDETLLGKWDSDFGKYISGCSDEEYAQMCMYYNERCITPLEYSIYGLDKRETKKGLRFASEMLISDLCSNADEESVIGDRYKEHLMLSDYYVRDAAMMESADDLVKFADEHQDFYLCPVSHSSGRRTYLIRENTKKDLRKYFEKKNLAGIYMADEKIDPDECMKGFIRRRTMGVKAATLNDGENVSLIFAISDFKFTGHDGEEEHTRDYFSYIKEDGTIDKKHYSFVRGLEKEECVESKVKRHKDEVPDWDGLQNMILDAASRFPKEFILGWDCIYSSKGWIIQDVYRNPSFKEAQIAWDRGMIRRIELRLNRKLETELWKAKAEPAPKE